MTIDEAQKIVDRVKEIRRDHFYDTEEVTNLKSELVNGGYVWSASYKAIPNPYA